MPLIRVELFDYRVTPEVSERLIAGMTDALCDAVHPDLRDHTWVIVEGHSPAQLGGRRQAVARRRDAARPRRLRDDRSRESRAGLGGPPDAGRPEPALSSGHDRRHDDPPRSIGRAVASGGWSSVRSASSRSTSSPTRSSRSSRARHGASTSSSALVPLALLAAAAVVHGGRDRACGQRCCSRSARWRSSAGASPSRTQPSRGPSGDDWTGLPLLVAGAVLIGVGARTLWRSRAPPWALAAAPLARRARRCVVAYELVVPVAFALVATHRPRGGRRGDDALAARARVRDARDGGRPPAARVVRPLDERRRDSRLPGAPQPAAPRAAPRPARLRRAPARHARAG